MKLADFCSVLAEHPDHSLRFVQSGGARIADHFHVTEVGRVEKQFFDCGGKRRKEITCVLQTLVAGDVDHRLTTTKLAKIMQMAEKLEIPRDVPVEVEHQERSIAIDAVDTFTAVDGMLEFHLSPKQTACLAEDACGITPPTIDSFEVLNDTGCCGDDSGCC